LYLALLEEARHFQIPRLETWLETQGYLEAVKLEYTATEFLEGCGFPVTKVSSDTWMEYFPGWGTRQVYVCPRGIHVHRGNPGACGRQCANAQPDSGAVYDQEPVVRTLALRKRIIFDQKACTDGR
jgi:hypothetical protein